MSELFGKCGHCKWWAMNERTGAVVHLRAECRRYAPKPVKGLRGSYGLDYRLFPVTEGLDHCGDYAAASREAFRADYAEELGPWITFDVLFGPRPPNHGR